MKKLVLAFVAIAAVSFASCNDKKNAAAGNNDTAAVDTAAVAVSYTHLTLPTTPYV